MVDEPTGCLRVCREAELDHAGYTNVHVMDNPLIVSLSTHRATSKPENYSGVKCKDLYGFSLGTVPDEKQLKNENMRTL